MTLRQLSDWLNRPEYLYQPNKLIQRVIRRNAVRNGVKVVVLPWHLPLELDTTESIGRIISHHGIFEMPVVEAIFRLVDTSDTVLDVGANIGYMAAAAAAAGAKRVISFEPNPAIFPRLFRNVERWRHYPGLYGRIEAMQKAIHSESGVSTLFIPRYSTNGGLSTLEMREGNDGYDKVQVPTTTLDAVIQELSGPVGILKIDIEGHELQALHGARESLSRRAIRDILYEEFDGASSQTTKFLASYGYSIFGLQRSITGPVLLPDLQPGSRLQGDHNLVATLDTVRLKRRMSARGFMCLSRKARLHFQN